jgi:hypothetical protein
MATPQLPQHYGDLCTMYEHILYIAEQTYEKLTEGSLPQEAIPDYALCWTQQLGVTLGIRPFVARQACILAHNWQTHGRKLSA